MKRYLKSTGFIFLLAGLLIIMQSCPKPKSLPSVTTTNVIDITQTTAVSGGNVTTNGGEDVTARGVCWGTTQKPTISASKTSDGTGNGAFISSITGLLASTRYYVRAYATNGEGTGYGNEVPITTSSIILATLTTTAINSITSTTAVSGGNISDDGGGTITARGVCWNTRSNPTTANNKTTDGTGTGSFTSNLINIQPGTTYYLKAYATNNTGTGYGNELNFITLCIAPTAITNAATSLASTTATLNGMVNANECSTTVTFDYGLTTSYGSTVTAEQSPLTGANSTAVSATISGLTSGWTYHFRVKASSSGGTTYSYDMTFTTTAVMDNDGNVYNTVTIGTQVWLKENLKTTKYNDGKSISNVMDNTAWAALTTPAYCWYNNDAATYKATYGALYNCYTVNSGKLCPAGWHVPTDAEWTSLTDYLGGLNVAGGKLKETGIAHWLSPNTGATNESGFTALPSGYRFTGGTFLYIGVYGYWWSSTEYSATNAYDRYMYNIRSAVSISFYPKQYGFSVRCLRDF